MITCFWGCKFIYFTAFACHSVTTHRLLCRNSYLFIIEIVHEVHAHRHKYTHKKRKKKKKNTVKNI